MMLIMYGPEKVLSTYKRGKTAVELSKELGRPPFVKNFTYENLIIKAIGERKILRDIDLGGLAHVQN